MNNQLRLPSGAVAKGVGRDAEEQRVLVVSFDRIPSDDDIRALHDALTSPSEDRPAWSLQ